MKYHQSLITHAKKYGASWVFRKYNKSRAYIYFWLARYDAFPQSLACRSRCIHGHLNKHTQEELKLVSNMRWRNSGLGIVEPWAWMRKRGCIRNVESL